MRLPFKRKPKHQSLTLPEIVSEISLFMKELQEDVDEIEKISEPETIVGMIQLEYRTQLFWEKYIKGGDFKWSKKSLPK